MWGFGLISGFLNPFLSHGLLSCKGTPIKLENDRARKFAGSILPLAA
jgi:hypothetical protein